MSRCHMLLVIMEDLSSLRTLFLMRLERSQDLLVECDRFQARTLMLAVEKFDFAR